MQHRDEIAGFGKPSFPADCIAPLLHLEGDRSVVEFLLLLPVHHMTALEQAARRRGQTVGQLARQLVREFLAGGRPISFETG